MAFDQTNADIATLSTLAKGIVSAFQSASSAAKSAQDALASGDSNISGQLQTIIQILQPLVPAPAANADAGAAATTS